MGDGRGLVLERWGLLRSAMCRVAVAVVALVAFSCGQGSENAVRVVGLSPASTSTAQPVPERTPNTPEPTARPGTGGTGDSGQPPDDAPGPGDESDEPSGPVGGTGVGGDGGAGVVPGKGDRPGGLRLLAPPPPYEGVANEIYDMCNDQQAYVAVVGRLLGPGDEITQEDRDAIAFFRRVNEVSCEEVGGRRYVYMSTVGPSGAFATAQAAIDDHNERNRYSDENLIRRPHDIPLGYFGHLEWDFPLEDIDEIALVEGSVLVRDGTVRGLVRNFSKTMFAREVTVTASPASGTGAQPASGRFPLTVQPGERAFFEIEGWTGSQDPADIDFEVTAKLSTLVDITRSFSFGTGGTVTTRAVDEEFFKNFVPDFVYQNEKHKIGDDGRLMIEYIDVSLSAPTSHPSLEDQVLNQNIQDLRVYMALIANGKVHDIVDPLPHRGLPEERWSPRDYPPVYSHPIAYNGAKWSGFQIVFIPDYSWHIWVGEPGPLDYNPRTRPETPLPTPNPDWIPRQEPQPPPE